MTLKTDHYIYYVSITRYDDFLEFLGRIQELLSCDNPHSNQVRDENLLNNRKYLYTIKGAVKSFSKIQNRV
jgi:hypothetical protein